MNFLVVTGAPTLYQNDKYCAYAPYVKEMDIWFEGAESVTIVSPYKYDKSLLCADFKREDIDLIKLPFLAFNSIYHGILSVILLPIVFIKILMAMRRADHIHLRCPGNIGLLGCFAQVFFPRKRKTAKYAGNWDPGSKQPWSYRLQKLILANEFLTRNMQVLVYGHWQSTSKNIKPFFTATYTEADDVEVPTRKYDLPLRFVFVGALVPGKRPVYALELVHELIKNGFPSELHFYGDGPERPKLEEMIIGNELEKMVYLHGNQTMENVRKSYLKSHFLILPSRSEGWPKVVAEAMWWGVIPMATPISCVPWMLDHGKRGILLETVLSQDRKKVGTLLLDKARLKAISKDAVTWSRQYTLDRFEKEIKKLI